MTLLDRKAWTSLGIITISKYSYLLLLPVARLIRSSVGKIQGQLALLGGNAGADGGLGGAKLGLLDVQSHLHPSAPPHASTGGTPPAKISVKGTATATSP